MVGGRAGQGVRPRSASHLKCRCAGVCVCVCTWAGRNQRCSLASLMPPLRPAAAQCDPEMPTTVGQQVPPVVHAGAARMMMQCAAQRGGSSGSPARPVSEARGLVVESSRHGFVCRARGRIGHPLRRQRADHVADAGQIEHPPTTHADVPIAFAIVSRRSRSWPKSWRSSRSSRSSSWSPSWSSPSLPSWPPPSDVDEGCEGRCRRSPRKGEQMPWATLEHVFCRRPSWRPSP